MSTAFTGAGMVYDHNELSRKATDFYLKSQVANSITNDPAFKTSRIAVTVFHRVVLITGQVPKEALREKAILLAQTVPNIYRIYNGLTIQNPVSLRQQTADTWITTKVKSKIITAKGINPSMIKVTTENAVVYLLGIVTHKQAAIVTHIAKNTSGVKKVVVIFFYVTIEGLDK